MKTVTYKGPDDPNDPTTRYRIGDHTLPKGVPTEVPEDVAKELKAAEGHNFTVSTKGTTKKNDKPAKGATQED